MLSLLYSSQPYLDNKKMNLFFQKFTYISTTVYFNKK